MRLGNIITFSFFWVSNSFNTAFICWLRSMWWTKIKLRFPRCFPPWFTFRICFRNSRVTIKNIWMQESDLYEKDSTEIPATSKSWVSIRWTPAIYLLLVSSGTRDTGDLSIVGVLWTPVTVKSLVFQDTSDLLVTGVLGHQQWLNHRCPSEISTPLFSPIVFQLWVFFWFFFLLFDDIYVLYLMIE